MARVDKYPEQDSEKWALDVYESIFEAFAERKKDLGRRKNNLVFSDHKKASMMAVSVDHDARIIRTALSFFDPNTAKPVRHKLGEVLDATMPVARTASMQHPQLLTSPKDTMVAAVVTETSMDATTIYYVDTFRAADGSVHQRPVHVINNAHDSFDARKYINQFIITYISNGDELTK